MIMTKTKTHKKTNTKTKTHTHRKGKYKVLPRPNVYYIFQKQGVQGFKILYWLSSYDDKDKDKDTNMVDTDMVDTDMVDTNMVDTVGIFQGCIFFRGEYF